MSYDLSKLKDEQAGVRSLDMIYYYNVTFKLKHALILTKIKHKHHKDHYLEDCDDDKKDIFPCHRVRHSYSLKIKISRAIE